MHLQQCMYVEAYIGDLKRWISRNHGQVGFYLTQAFTGHGCFKSYTGSTKLKVADVKTVGNNRMTIIKLSSSVQQQKVWE